MALVEHSVPWNRSGTDGPWQIWTAGHEGCLCGAMVMGCRYGSSSQQAIDDHFDDQLSSRTLERAQKRAMQIGTTGGDAGRAAAPREPTHLCP
jgi:hypothetical protein